MKRTKEIGFIIDASFMEKLQNTLGINNDSEIAVQALALLDWAVRERASGRVIVSTESDGSNIRKLVTPALEHASKKKDSMYCG